MARMILITGPMASGKSTAAQAIAEKLSKAVHLRGDTFRKMIVSGRVDMSADAGEEAFAQLRLRYKISAQAARMYFEAGFDVVLQDNYYGEMLPYMIELLNGLPTQVIVLCPTAEAVETREAQRGKVGYTGYSVRPLVESFMKETPRLGVWVDNTDFTPEQTADTVYNIIINNGGRV